MKRVLVALLFAVSTALVAQNGQLEESAVDKKYYKKLKAYDFAEAKKLDDPAARLEFERLLTADPATGEIPLNARQRELEFFLSRNFSNPRGRSAATVDWYNRGPRNVGGRTRALAVDSRNEDIILAGGVSGGMWRSTDQGVNWVKVTDVDALQSVTCIAQDPSAPDTWYYGTGEYFGNSARDPGANFDGDGIFKSTDNGVTWVQLEATANGIPETRDDFDIIHEIKINSTGDLLVGTLDGVYLSADGGVTFDLILTNDENSDNIGDGEWTDIFIDANDVAYAALDNIGVFRSDDAANDYTSWTEISFGITFSNDFSVESGARLELAVAPSNTDILYVLREDGIIWKYEYDEVEPTWTAQSSQPPFAGIGGWNPQGGYNLVITVMPDDEDFIVYGGTNLYRTTDGFASPSNISWIGGYGQTSFVYPNQHPDQHSFVWLRDESRPEGSQYQRFISGNDGGVQITSDITRSTGDQVDPVIWTSLNNGYLTTQSYAVSVGPGDQIMSGFQDNSTWLTTSTNASVDWVDVFSGDGAYSAFSTDGTERYLSSQGGNIARLSYSDANDVTADAGVSFEPPEFPGNLFINPFYLDPINDDLFYLPGDNPLWVNTQANTGSSGIGWKTIDIPNNAQITTELGVSRNNLVYVGTSTGQIFKIVNPGGDAQVTEVTGNNFPSGYISGVAVNQLDSDEVLICFSNYNIASLFHTTDGGQNWTDVGGNLEGGTGLAPSMRHVQILGDNYFVGTSVGLFSTTDLDGASTTWSQESSELIGNVVVDHFAAKASDGTIVAGTHGNGIYSAQFDVPGLPEDDLFMASIVAPNSGLLNDQVDVIIAIGNAGSVAQSNFEVSYTIDEGTPVEETVSATVAPGEVLEYTFTTTADLSSNDEYEISTSVNLEGDINTGNNSLSKTIQSITTVPLSNYSESFEDGEAGWTPSGSWELGTPNMPNISGASDGSNAWATNLNGDYPNNDNAFLESPFFDFSEVGNVTFEFDINFDIERDQTFAWDGITIGYRTNAESGYEIVPTEAGIENWYNEPEIVVFSDGPGWGGSSGGNYQRAKASLAFLGGEPFVQLAFIFISDGSVTEDGAAIDNIVIQESISDDLELTSIPSPDQIVSGAETLTAVVTNVGFNTYESYDVAFSVNDSPFETVNVSNPIVAGESVEVTTSGAFDFSSSGIYEIEATVIGADDENAENDDATKTVYNLDFTGYYVMTQDAPSIGGPSYSTHNSYMFGATGTTTVFLTAPTETSRSMNLGYLSYLGFNNDRDYTFQLSGGSVIFDDGQETGLTCSQVPILLGTADSPGSYNELDDSQFTLTLKENTTSSCETGSFDVSFTLTKLDAAPNATDVAALEALYASTNGDDWVESWDLTASPYSWSGLTFNDQGRAIEIDLYNNNLTGVLPTELNDLSALTSLLLKGTTNEALVGNSIGGSLPVISGLTNLEVIDFGFQPING